MRILAVLAVGLLLGLRHAMDPDHVVAVTAIASRARRAPTAVWLGVAWGLGHTVTLFVAGGAIILFDLVVPARVGLALQLAVALALTAVGLLNLLGPARTTGPRASSAPVPSVRAFAVGLVHGLAGSAAVSLLVLGAIRRPVWALGYLLVFGLGTIAGMAAVTATMAAPLRVVARRWPDAGDGIRLATGVASLAFGIWLAYEVGWVNGLFGAVPSWTPR